MKRKKTIRITAYFMLFTGIINLLMWLFLITSGQVEDFSSEPVAYVFHWTSEFATALLLITAGFQALRSTHPRMNLMFLGLGFLLMAIGGAFYHYLVHFETALFLFTSLFTVATIVFIIAAYQGMKDFIFLASGVTLYGLINIMGQGFQDGNQTLISMSVPSALFMLLLLVGLFHRETRLSNTPTGRTHGSGATGNKNKQ